jgi:hypothetical protein
MRDLSKEEMKAVSGGIEKGGVNARGNITAAIANGKLGDSNFAADNNPHGKEVGLGLITAGKVFVV